MITNNFCSSFCDEELVKLIKRGDSDAFEMLFKRHQHFVFLLCLQIVENIADAEEVTQDVFMQVHKELKNFQGRCKFTSWLYRIAVNQAGMRMREGWHKKKRRTVSVDELTAQHRETGKPLPRQLSVRDMALESAGGHGEFDLLYSYIGDLPIGYRTAIELRYLHEYSLDEMVVLLRCKKGTCKSQLGKGLTSLRERFAGRGPRGKGGAKPGSGIQECARTLASGATPKSEQTPQLRQTKAGMPAKAMSRAVGSGR